MYVYVLSTQLSDFRAAVGDIWFKIPAIYTNRVFLNFESGFTLPDRVRGYIGRNLTPPYMSGVPDVTHVELTSISGDKFLVLCSDGLTDSYEADRMKLDDVLAPRFVELVGKDYGGSKHLALSLLRDALGGEDEDKLSRFLTVEMDCRWQDDTTVLVQRL